MISGVKAVSQGSGDWGMTEHKLWEDELEKLKMHSLDGMGENIAKLVKKARAKRLRMKLTQEGLVEYSSVALSTQRVPSPKPAT